MWKQQDRDHREGGTWGRMEDAGRMENTENGGRRWVRDPGKMEDTVGTGTGEVGGCREDGGHREDGGCRRDRDPGGMEGHGEDRDPGGWRTRRTGTKVMLGSS